MNKHQAIERLSKLLEPTTIASNTALGHVVIVDIKDGAAATEIGQILGWIAKLGAKQ